MTDQPRIPLAGVIGSPIAHSKSPRLHAHWLRTYGIRGYYIPMDVAQTDLREVVAALPKAGFVGVNVTIPHKESVLGLADVVTDRAALIGAANTLIFRSDGRIHADNTDGFGFIANLRQNALSGIRQRAPRPSSVQGAPRVRSSPRSSRWAFPRSGSRTEPGCAPRRSARNSAPRFPCMTGCRPETCSKAQRRS